MFGFEEYLLPESTLGSYAYVHNCIAFGKDIRLELDEVPQAVPKNFDELSVRSSVTQYFPCVQKNNLELLIQTLKSEMEKTRGTVKKTGKISLNPTSHV